MGISIRFVSLLLFVLAATGCIAGGGGGLGDGGTDGGQPADAQLFVWGETGYEEGLGSATHAAYGVLELEDVSEMSVGDEHTLILLLDGTVWGFGSNNNGQLGTGDRTDTIVFTPVQVSGLTNVVSISAGRRHSLAATQDGSVWAWGDNNNAQLGDGTPELTGGFSYTPVQVVDGAGGMLTDIVQVTAGNAFSMALTSSGDVWSWGNGYSGNLGNGTEFGYAATPVQALVSSITFIAAGFDFGLALDGGGNVWTWGNNTAGELGTGSLKSQETTPTRVAGINGVTQVAVGMSVLENHVLALRGDGSVWAWGFNEQGQLGDDTLERKSEPVPTTGVADVAQVAAGRSHSLVLLSDGTVLAWGDGRNYQLGNGNQNDSIDPVQVQTLLPDFTLVALENVTQIAAGGDGSVALK